MNHLFKSCFLAFFFLSSSFFSFSRGTVPSVSAGDIAFIGFSADSPDGFSIVALKDLDGSSTSLDIHFTDNEWINNGGSMQFNSGEGDLIWTVNVLISAGTVVTFSNTQSIGGATVSSGTIGAGSTSINLNGADEQVYAFVGSLATPTDFIAAISTGTSDNFVDSDTDSRIDGTETGNIGSTDSGNDNAGLLIGSTAIDFSSKTDKDGSTTNDKDILAYFGSRDTETQSF